MEIKTKHYLFVAIALVVGLLLGYGLGASQGRKSASAEFQERIEQAKKFFPGVEDIRFLSGVIKEIGNSRITIEITSFLNPFEDWLMMREVIIISKTKIVKQELKDQEVFQKETEAYQKAANFSIPPSPFSEHPVSLNDLNVGDRVSVEAEENIKPKTRFEAKQIIIQQSPLSN